jgi:hypothetical protein
MYGRAVARLEEPLADQVVGASLPLAAKNSTAVPKMSLVAC